MISSLRNATATLALGLSCLGAAAQAGPYSGVTFFGDSLSDTGNVLSLTTTFGLTPFPNYVDAPGRFSNGPVWLETLAAGLGVPVAAAPANLLFAGAPGVIPIGAPAGSNYAFGGARTGLGGSAGATTGLVGQLINWNGSAFAASLTRAADPDALYVVMAGGNDMRDARSAFPSGSAGDAAGRQSAAEAAAQNIVNAIGLLAQAGARHFLVGNLPDLGRTPEAVALGLAAPSTDVTGRFNLALDAGVDGFDALFAALTGVDLDIKDLDFAQLSDAVYDDATTNGGAVFGITNVAAPCIEPAAPGAYFVAGATDADGNCGSSSFSDPLHPSAAVHRLLGLRALAVVPAPATWLLVAAVFCAGALRRRVR